MKNYLYLAFLGGMFLFSPPGFGQQKPAAKPSSAPAGPGTKPATEPEVPVTFAGVSPIVLDNDRSEISLTNTVSSFWLAQIGVHPDVRDVASVINRHRYSRMDNILRAAHGFSRSGRWDLGAELRFASARLDDKARGSFMQLFSGDNGTGTTQSDLAYIGLRSRITPFEGAPAFTLQVYANYPMTKKADKARALGAERVLAGATVNYYAQFNERVYCFLQNDIGHHFASSSLRSNTVSNSMGGFLVFSNASHDFFVFPGISFAHNFQYSSGRSLFAAGKVILGSVGASWQPSDRLNVFANWNAPFLLESGSPYFEWVRESYQGFAVGVRWWTR